MICHFAAFATFKKSGVKKIFKSGVKKIFAIFLLHKKNVSGVKHGKKIVNTFLLQLF